MKRVLTYIKNIIIDPKDIRISIFNIMAVMGGTVSLFAFIISVINGADILNLTALLFCAVTASVLLAYSKKTKNYRLCYLITTIVVYVIMFPIVFFTAGGLHSGMPMYFVFAVSYTVFMLENRTGLFIAIGEIIEYAVCSFIAMYYPQTVIPFDSQRAVETDIISCIIVCCTALAITLHLQITLYHSQQEKTEEALKEVSRQSRAKDMFLANMSHEIRTPINMILGMSEMISRTSSDEQTLDYNKKICSFGKKLLTMIKDILDITKIQTGQSELVNAPYSLSEVVNELTDLGNELAAQ